MSAFTMRWIVFLFATLAAAQQAPGLRLSAVFAPGGEPAAEAAIENVPDREFYVPLGIAGVNRPEQLKAKLTLPDGSWRWLQDLGGSGLAPGAMAPLALPLFPHSRYVIRTRLGGWHTHLNRNTPVTRLLGKPAPAS